VSTPGDTKSLIETAITRFLADVPALAPLKLVAGVELRGRGDVQMYRVVLPGPVVTKDIASDSQVRLEVQRAAFNELATKGHVADWRSAFEHGEAKVTGVESFIRLITQVVERQEERSRTRRAKAH
jgi:hypothetical protein